MIVPALPQATPHCGHRCSLSEDGQSRSERLLFVDVMRGLVMIVMIEVHVINGLMHPVYRRAPWFGLLDFVNGLAAPSFLFISGFAFFLSSQNNRAGLKSWGAPIRHTLGRIGLIWLLGYLLHLPYFSLHTWQQFASSEQLQQFLSVDILQCIACSLFVLLVLRLLSANERIFLAAVAITGCATVLAAVKLYQADIADTLPFFLTAYFIPVGSTHFPLLPWFGFMAAGVLAARFFLHARQKDAIGRAMQRVALLGLMMILIGLPLLVLLKDRLGLIVDERPHPLFFAARLGCVLLLLALCYWICRDRKKPVPFLLYPSRESLLVYIVHLQILYWPFWQGKSMVMWAAQGFSLATSLSFAAVLTGLMLPLARCWHFWKMKHQRASRSLLAATMVGGTVLFLVV